MEAHKGYARKNRTDFFTGEAIYTGEMYYKWTTRFGSHFSKRKPSQREMRVSLALRALYSAVEDLEGLTELSTNEEFIEAGRVALGRTDEAYDYYKSKGELTGKGPLYILPSKDWLERINTFREETKSYLVAVAFEDNSLARLRLRDILLAHLPKMGE